MRSFASGGCTSTKYEALMYFPAKRPKCTSSNLMAIVSKAQHWQREYKVCRVQRVSAGDTLWKCNLHNALRSRQTEESHRTRDEYNDHEQLPLCWCHVYASEGVEFSRRAIASGRLGLALICIEKVVARSGESLGVHWWLRCRRGRRCRSACTDAGRHDQERWIQLEISDQQFFEN